MVPIFETDDTGILIAIPGATYQWNDGSQVNLLRLKTCVSAVTIVNSYGPWVEAARFGVSRAMQDSKVQLTSFGFNL